MHHIATGPRYDLIALSHRITEVEAMSSSSPAHPLRASVGRERAFTMSGILSDVLLPPSEADLAEQRRYLGVPATLAYMRHPELGSLGELLVDAGLASFILIYHEPRSGLGMRGRDLGVVGAVPFTRAVSESSGGLAGAGAGGALMHTILESDDDLAGLAGGAEPSSDQGAAASSGSSIVVAVEGGEAGGVGLTLSEEGTARTVGGN